MSNPPDFNPDLDLVRRHPESRHAGWWAALFAFDVVGVMLVFVWTVMV